MSEIMKNCPFCGGEPRIKREGNNTITLRCAKCLAGFRQRFLRLAPEKLVDILIADWNKRIDEVKK